MADLEREILRALCKDSRSRAKRKEITAQLAAHIWNHSENRVVYEAICRLGNRNASILRAELPAEATRMGFPDIDWKAYFDSPPVTAAAISDLICQLKRRDEA